MVPGMLAKLQRLSALFLSLSLLSIFVTLSLWSPLALGRRPWDRHTRRAWERANPGNEELNCLTKKIGRYLTRLSHRSTPHPLPPTRKKHGHEDFLLEKILERYLESKGSPSIRWLKKNWTPIRRNWNNTLEYPTREFLFYILRISNSSEIFVVSIRSRINVSCSFYLILSLVLALVPYRVYSSKSSGFITLTRYIRFGKQMFLTNIFFSFF